MRWLLFVTVAWVGCNTLEKSDEIQRDEEINSLRLTISSLEARLDEMADKLESVEDISMIAREDVKEIQQALAPKPPKKKAPKKGKR